MELVVYPLLREMFGELERASILDFYSREENAYLEVKRNSQLKLEQASFILSLEGEARVFIITTEKKVGHYSKIGFERRAVLDTILGKVFLMELSDWAAFRAFFEPAVKRKEEIKKVLEREAIRILRRGPTRRKPSNSGESYA